MSRRQGYTLAEIVLVLAIMGLTSMIAVRGIQPVLDRIATRSSAQEAADIIGRARDEALARRTIVSVRIDTATATIDLDSRDGRIARLSLGAMHSVTLATTRDSISFDVRGLGYGAANTTIVARRGRAADTTVVSRVGRVR